MNLLFYMLNTIVFFLYFQTSNYFYYIFNSKNIDYKKMKKFLILQAIGSLLYPYLKENYNILASLMSYTFFFLGTFMYDISLKKRITYYLFLIAINTSGEMISTSCIILILSFLLNKDATFTDTLIKTNPFYYVIGLLGCVICVFLVMRYVKSLSKNMTAEQLKQIYKISFLPFIIAFMCLNFIYTTNKETFLMVFIITWIIIMITVFIIIKGINKYQMMQKESIKNKAQQEILNMQIEDMKSIDEYYQTMRRKNHDFKNHCLVVLNMLENHDEKVKDYLLSMKEGHE